MTDYSISLIISAYNEEPIIEDCVRTCIDSLSNHFNDYELILINDASTDRTGQLMDELAIKHKNIVTIHNKTNMNMGASIQHGMLTAKKDYVTFNAADLPFDPDKYKVIMDNSPEADMIVVQRIKYNGTTKWRRISSLLNRAFMRILFPILKWKIRDTNYLQITRRTVLPFLMPLAQGPIFTWPEMIFRARHLKLKVKTANARYIPKHVRKGAFGKPDDILSALKEMLHFRYLLWSRKI